MTDQPLSLDEILYKYGADLTDVQHIKMRTALNRLLLQEQIDECKRAANHNNSEYTSDYLEARITALQS